MNTFWSALIWVAVVCGFGILVFVIADRVRNGD